MVATKEVVQHPEHYNMHPSGIECIDIIEHMNFNCGSAIKYIWRADHKENAVQDLKKARFLIDREIARREDGQSKEKGNGESDINEHIKSEWTIKSIRCGPKTDHEEGSVPAFEHNVQYIETWEDYRRMEREAGLHCLEKIAESRKASEQAGDSSSDTGETGRKPYIGYRRVPI